MYTTKIVNVEAKLSDGSMIKGKINIRDHNRVTDYLRQIQDQFIVIVSEGAGESSQKVFCINMNYVLWVSPADLEENR
jgi:hypothetical protein